jgi:DNA-binding SARP family transcriptional activator
MIAKSNINYSIFIFRVVLLLSAFMITVVSYAQTYGLKFQSHDVVLDKRTELNLSPDYFFKFQDEFEISFDYRIDLLRPTDYSALFGYVFRVISLENYNIDLLITPTPTINLNLVIGKNNSIIQVGSPNNAIDGWVNLRVKFLLNEDRLIFYTPDTFYVQENVGLKSNDSFKIIFGANDCENFKTSDVPSMSIKEIRIFEKGKLKYHWPLDEEKGNIAENTLSKKVASVKNPSWLKNNHQAWELRYQNEIEGFILVASDTENGKIFLVGEDELFIYSAQENNIRLIKYRDKPLFLTNNYKAIYNSRDKNILCYMLDKRLIYNLDILTGEWNEIGETSASESNFMHHNSYFNPEENSIYIFGGYGMHTYHNDINRVDLTKNEWQVLSTDKNIFPPRYLAGLGSLNDTIYLLGGYGSLTGSQMVNPHSYFDLLGYSIKNHSLFKKFEIPRLIDDMCIANNIWIDKKNRDYYALVFEKIKFEGALQLIKGNVDNPNVKKVGDEIPFKFQDVKSYASLFYFPKQKKLFAFTSFATDSSTSLFDIYSIDYPPNDSNIEPLYAKSRKNLLFIYFAITFVFLSGFLYWYIKWKRMAQRISVDTNDLNELAITKESVTELPIENPKYQLVFFGGFQVFSKSYKDITNKFSPLLKELFLLILLYTHKDNKGISSEKISEYLWFDKSELSARNNRAVNIAKLKSILAEIGAIELTKKTGYWKILYNYKDVKSDYAEFLQITSSKSNLTKQNISRLVDITQRGAFLINSNYEWLDDFKSDVSDKIVDTLVAYAEKCDLKTDAEFIVHLADCIFNFDRSNEEAMVLKCKAEYCLGKHSLAKLTYEKFIKEYQQLYNEEYKKSFNEILDFSVILH